MSDRAKYTYAVPKHLAQHHGVSSVTLVELTAEEELLATNRARNDVARLAFELAKQSLVALDGRPLSTVDGSLDSQWQKLHPKIRSLVMNAYGQLHQTNHEETAAFLQSRQVEV